MARQRQQSDKSGSYRSQFERKLSDIPVKPRSRKYHIQQPDDSKLPRLMALEDAGGKYIEKLIIQKLELCCLIYDFWDEKSNLHGKKVKTETLTELIGWVNKSKSAINEAIIAAIFKMITVNIFRPIIFEEDFSAEYVGFEESWPHLNVVYKLFEAVLDTQFVPLPVLNRYVDNSFISQILQNLNSIDPKERLTIKSILHKIYSKFLKYRNFIRQQMNNIFLIYIYETDRMRGISELLEIYGSIISGFILPLKKEHVNLLNKVLLPLHIPPSLYSYHRELVYCIMQYLDKNGKLVKTVLLGLLKYWPKTCSSKQILFLSEVEEILDVIQPQEFISIYKPLFEKLAICSTSANFLVAQRALIMYKNEYFTTLVEDNINLIMPIMFPPLYATLNNHWNACIKELIKQVLSFYRIVNIQIYDDLREELDSTLVVETESFDSF